MKNNLHKNKVDKLIRKEIDERSLPFLKKTIIILGVIFSCLFVINIFFKLSHLQYSYTIYASLIAINVLLYILVIKGYRKIASYLLVFSSWLAMLYFTWSGYGIYSPANMGMLVIILFSTLLINRSISILVAALTLINYWVIGVMIIYGKFDASFAPPVNYIRDFTFIITATILLVIFYESTMRKSVNKIIELSLQREIDQKKINDFEVNYQEIFESITDAILIHNPETGAIVDVNLSACTMFGYQKKEFTALTIEDLSASEEGFTAKNAYEKLKLTEQIGNSFFEWRSKRANGNLFWTDVQLKASIINGENRILAVVRDNDKNKQAQIALQSSEERIKATLEYTPNVAIQWYDLSGKIIYWNKASENLFGFTPAQSIGKTLDQLIYSKEETEQFLQILNQIDQNNCAIGPYESPIINRNGEKKVLLSTNFSIPSDTGNKIFVCMDIDITEQKLAEEKILLLNESLEQKVLERTEQLNRANKDLEAFTTGVSHDLRAPLRHIDGFTQLMYLSIPQPNEKIKSHYDRIIYSARRMTSMIDDLLNFSRLGRKEIQVSQIDLNNLVNEVIEILKPDAAGRNINWQLNPLPVVFADKNLMKLVFENLLSNALKYTRQRNEAIIEIGMNNANEETVEIFIKDNGAGFEMEYADKLFGVFQRLHTTDEFEGTGIGLANVKQIITKHKGKVWANGLPNIGATFYFSLPK